MKKSFEKAQRRRDSGLTYKHDLGQHFLYDEALLQALVKSTGVTKADGVLEIGPGSGMLTQFLCRDARQVVAVEVDEAVIPFLKVKTQRYDNLQIVQGDIRRLDLGALCQPLGEGFWVIANIPYNITTPILEMLWGCGLPIRQMALMIQKEVADKLMAAPSTPHYSLTSVIGQYHCDIRLEAVVPAEAFTPPPKVDSAFVHLTPRLAPLMPAPNEKRLFAMLRTSFGMRRKTLRNALKGVVEPERLTAAMEALGLPPTARGEELDVQQWIALCNACD